MPLSDHEQRILEEIERRLVAEDPKFAREVSAGGSEGAALRKVKRAVAGFALGFLLLITGLFIPDLLVVFGIAAFAVMVACAATIASGIKQVGRERPEGGKRTGWFARMEERWRNRYERGGDGT
ncbi:MAG: DUF3040 domain-containing protein [Actinomycetota bacterium]